MFHHIHLFINIMKARKRWKQFQKTKFKGRWNLYNLLQTTTNHLSPISDRPFSLTCKVNEPHKCPTKETPVWKMSHTGVSREPCKCGKKRRYNHYFNPNKRFKDSKLKANQTLNLYSRQKHGVKYKKQHEFCFICIHSARMIRCRYIF